VKHQLEADARGVITPLDSPVPDSKIVGDLENAYALLTKIHMACDKADTELRARYH
jgi:hypothetical protein